MGVQITVERSAGGDRPELPHGLERASPLRF
jgi:hypothetical protein